MIDKGEFDAARAELRKGREAARALREDISRSEAGFLFDEARVDRLQLNYDAASAKFLEAARLDPDIPWIWIELGDHWVIRGSLTEAGEAFRAAMEAAGRSGDERDLSVSHNKIGDVQQAQGDLAAALTSYQASLDIFDRLAQSGPRQRRLAARPLGLAQQDRRRAAGAGRPGGGADELPGLARYL